MGELAPIVIPASTALAAGLAATAGTLFVGRERTTQRIDRLTQSMERCKDDELLTAEFRFTLASELSLYRAERHGEWRERLMTISLGSAFVILGYVILYASGHTTGGWTFYGYMFMVFGLIVAFTFPLRWLGKLIREKKRAFSRSADETTDSK